MCVSLEGSELRGLAPSAWAKASVPPSLVPTTALAEAPSLGHSYPGTLLGESRYLLLRGQSLDQRQTQTLKLEAKGRVLYWAGHPLPQVSCLPCARTKIPASLRPGTWFKKDQIPAY